MTRLRYNGLSTTLGVPGLTSSATAVTFAAALTHSGGTAVPTIGAGDYIPLTILDAAGNASEIVYLTAYTAAGPTGTITRGREGTTGVAHASGDKVVHGPTVDDVTGILAFKEATASATYTTASTTDADVDATNLAVTFTVPASGSVKVDLEGYANWSQAGGGYEWMIRESTTTVKVVSMQGSFAGTLRARASFVVTGLTPGASVTYKWGFRRAGASGTHTLYTGGAVGANGNAQMTVTAMP